MANLLHQITIGDIRILILDSDPSINGYDAYIGSLAIVDGLSGVYQKYGPNDTDWNFIALTQQDVKNIIGNTLIDSADIDFVYDVNNGTVEAHLTPTGIQAGSYGVSNKVPVINVDNKGRLTNISLIDINIDSSQISDFTEAVQDAIGLSFVNTDTIIWNYDDANNTISADVNPNNISHGSLSNLNADDHPQYALLNGRNNGQTLYGGINASENLTLISTSHPTKGNINIGNTVYVDENNQRIGINITNPNTTLHIVKNNVNYLFDTYTVNTNNATQTVLATLPTVNNSTELVKVYITALRTDGSSNDSAAFERTFRIKNTNGTASVWTVQSNYTSRDATLNGTNVTIAASGSNVEIRVIGINGVNITWHGIVKRIR